ncbi:hypothetical protein K4A83_18890 [Spirulina subsalsa FACHB-351]|uniref:Uncharacterized protein n=1 Tax=Spirulina subsalsa FACHB-351 TaxID=234711 RepID=A0ABT3L9Z9_9CYAN|nr:hypothetical protein [Spirulina subsalsa]MCW6038325.1 hypothetical protein [Spirulina subsalsa FACHB-351]
MWHKIWQWIKKAWQRLFGRSTSTGVSTSLVTPESEPAPSSPLSDSDLEFLFTQLLEGVSHGWQSHRVQKFFEQSQERVNYVQWVNWLQGFGGKVLASGAPNLELARRLELLAVQTQYLEKGWAEVGAVAYAIASQLFQRESQGVVWEYDGPDVGVSEPGLSSLPFTPDVGEGQEVLTLEQLVERMTEQPELRNAIAQQAGIESDDPQAIVQALVQTLLAQQQQITPPEDSQGNE